MTSDHAAHPGEGRTVEIFVSYSARTDAGKALSDHLLDLLTSAFALPPQAVFAYTVAGHGAKSGGRLMDELKEALAESKVVLAIATPAAAQSSYGQFEVAASDLAGKYRVPLLPDPSFHTHVPAVFREITARSLASMAEICQLIEDMREPLGRATVEPACLWITKVERVIEAAHELSGHISHEARAARLATDLAASNQRYSRMRTAAMAAAGVSLAAALSVAVLAVQLTEKERDWQSVSMELTTYRQTIENAEKRGLFLPALKIEGTVTTASGQPADRAIVAACAAVPRVGAAGPQSGEVCPDDLRLNFETDSDGVFRLDLRSLPLPQNVNQSSPLEEIWLTAQHAGQGRVQTRVRTVLDKKLTLRP